MPTDSKHTHAHGKLLVEGDRIAVGDIARSAVAIGREARATINQYTEIIVRADNFEDLPPAPGEPPYKGLAYFTEADKDIFFGRETLSDQLVERLRRTPFLALIGASGSGKTSLLRAGIIPRLRAYNWQITVVKPGIQPLNALASGLTREDSSLTAAKDLRQALLADAQTLNLTVGKLAARRDTEPLLLAVDQFEELFTQATSAEHRQALVDNLVAAAEGGVATVLISMRADFYGCLSEFSPLADLVSRQQAYIKPMVLEDLVRVIAEPARLGGWQFVDGLVEQLVEDVALEPGRLPLLSHALLETWERRRSVVMTLGGYRAAGGVEGAIAQTAEETLAHLVDENPAYAEITRKIFLSLTELNEDAEDTRRVASREELSAIAEKAQLGAVLEELVFARLVTIDKDQVEVAHEALIRRWPTLHRWLEEDREALRLHRRLANDAHSWEALDHDPGSLYRGLRLALAEEFASSSRYNLTELDRRFLTASRLALEAEDRAREDERQRIRRSALLALVAGSIVFPLTMRLVYRTQINSQVLLNTMTLIWILPGALAGFFLVVLVDMGAASYRGRRRSGRALLVGGAGSLTFALLLVSNTVLTTAASSVGQGIIFVVLQGAIWGFPAGLGRHWMQNTDRTAWQALGIISLVCGIALLISQQFAHGLGEVEGTIVFLAGAGIPLAILGAAYSSRLRRSAP